MFQARSLEKFEATPLVVDGVMYTVQPPNDIMALDAATGRISGCTRIAVAAARPCCGRVNRGLAILGDTLFMGTIDGHLIAVDAKTGSRSGTSPSPPQARGLRDHPGAAGRQGQGHRRHRGRRVRHPRVHRRLRRRDRQGSLAVQHDSRAGRARQRDMGRRLVEDRRRLDVGDRLLRSRSEPHVLGHRQSRARLERRHRGRRQPLHDSVVALDADTGKLKWHFQFTPHDELDWDSAQVPVLVDMRVARPSAQSDAVGEPQRVLLRARPGDRRVPARASRS